MTGYPQGIFEAAASNVVLPDRSVVLQNGNPMFMDFFRPDGKGVEMFPIERRFDYVTTMVAPSSISGLGPKPDEYHQRIIPELVADGTCSLPFPATVAERPETVGRFLAEGRRVFLHAGRTFSPSSGEGRKVLEPLRGNFETRTFGTWEVPAVAPNPVRHLYDRFVFPGFAMDSRPATASTYFEILPKTAFQ